MKKKKKLSLPPSPPYPPPLSLLLLPTLSVSLSPSPSLARELLVLTGTLRRLPPSTSLGKGPPTAGSRSPAASIAVSILADSTST